MAGSRPEATSLPPSMLFSSLPSRGLSSLHMAVCRLGRARLTAAKHFDAIYAVKRTAYKIHIDV